MGSVEQLQKQLDEWADAQQSRPSKSDFEANPIYGELMRLSKEEAEKNYMPGGCKNYSSRRRRYCALQATLGYEYCSLHRPSSSTQEPNNSAVEITCASKKTNLKRKLKRCLNPFLVPEIENAPDWSTLFSEPSRLTWLDIGCAKGMYMKHQRDYNSSISTDTDKWNYLGVELFKPLVEAANQQFKQPNLAYIHANINKSLEALMIPNLQRVSFMFPDPWSAGENASKKNLKKRVMNPDFARAIAKLMVPGSDIYFASDWHDLALDIRQCLLSTGCFSVPTAPHPYAPSKSARDLLELQPGKKDAILIDTKTDYEKKVQLDDKDDALWLDRIPFNGIQTERDLVCESQWRRVYRLVLLRI